MKPKGMIDGTPDEIIRRNPLISVIVAVFNAVATLQRCIDSFSDQTYPDKELIIIDGGSNDGSLNVLEANANRITYWESKPDRGIYHAWNKGLAHTRGEWLYFMGADDYFWSSDVLDRMAPHLTAAYPPLAVVYGRRALVNDKGQTLSLWGQNWARIRQEFLQHQMTIPHQCLFHHRSLFLNGGFDETFRITGDYELLLRYLKWGEARFVENLIVAGMRVGGLSTTRTNLITMVRENIRAQKKNRIPVSVLHQGWAFAKIVARLGLLQVAGERGTARLTSIWHKLIQKPRGQRCFL